MKKHIIIIIIAIGILSTCRKKEVDPCLDEHPVTADFHIYEEFQTEHPDEWEPYDTDTIMPNAATFVALEEDATYEWTLGAETIREKSFTRSEFPRGKHISVLLKVTKEPNSSCFPEDDGLDIKVRNLYAYPYSNVDPYPPISCESLPINGRFKGHYIEDEEDRGEFTLEIDRCYIHPENNPFNDITLRIINLEPNCDMHTYFSDLYRGYKQVYFNRYNGCQHPKGLIRVYGNYNDSIAIKYDLLPNIFLDDTIPKIFVGKRVN